MSLHKYDVLLIDILSPYTGFTFHFDPPPIPPQALWRVGTCIETREVFCDSPLVPENLNKSSAWTCSGEDH